mgnify:CR=1 FL=1
MDARRSKLFSMLGRQISVEAKKAGGDKNNPVLRKAMEKARAANMPNENIERAIEKGLGNRDQGLEEVMYEAYGPGGTALIITGISDNKNRTSQEIKHLLAEHDSALATPGAALWAFAKNNDGEWQAKNFLNLNESEAAQLTALTETIETHDDIKKVYTNAVL